MVVSFLVFMEIEKLKKKLFEKTKEKNISLFFGLPLKEDYSHYYAKYRWQDNNIVAFVEFANKVGVKCLYYDLLVDGDVKIDKPLIGLMVYFKFKEEFHKFCWLEDSFYNRSDEKPKKRKIIKDKLRKMIFKNKGGDKEE
jgi:hypothetical protein